MGKQARGFVDVSVKGRLRLRCLNNSQSLRLVVYDLLDRDVVRRHKSRRGAKTRTTSIAQVSGSFRHDDILVHNGISMVRHVIRETTCLDRGRGRDEE